MYPSGFAKRTYFGEPVDVSKVSEIGLIVLAGTNQPEWIDDAAWLHTIARWPRAFDAICQTRTLGALLRRSADSSSVVADGASWLSWQIAFLLPRSGEYGIGNAERRQRLVPQFVDAGISFDDAIPFIAANVMESEKVAMCVAAGISPDVALAFD